MTACTLTHVGLDHVAAHLRDLGLGELTVTEVRTVLGRADLAGSSRPLPSSAARIRLGEAAPIWVPAPEEPACPAEGRAPLLWHAGRELVLPAVRLFVGGTDEGPEAAAVEYLGLSDWLHDAVACWRFEPAREGGPPRALLDHLREERRSAAEALRGVATVLCYALFGADGPSTVCGLRLPAAPMWLRPVGETPFARNVARSLVITARLETDPARPAVPTTNLRAAGYRIRPADTRDWGLDPVHTPEGADIRMTGRLGLGVALGDRRLYAPDPERPPLGTSTARLPFAGYNDPRRLLMAANMQAHALPLPEQEPPRVRQSCEAADPPGVNLRVAYLAWQGWNHEDAWVLSASAARRLGTAEELVQTIAIRAAEVAPELLVEAGQTVERDQLLVRRFVAPALLCSSLPLLAGLEDFDEWVQLRPEGDDFAPDRATVTAVEGWDLHDRSGLPPDWLIPAVVEGAFRAVYRIHLRRDLPLEVGDKLANRHGHKGIVGAIVPDEQMPRWRGRPLEALLDPISVLNRSNWGQVYEALAGALVDPGQSRDFSPVSGEQVVKEAEGLGADAQGRWPIEPPAEAGWLTGAVRAVAGVQFVMRMPHHACDRISGSPLPPPQGNHHQLRRRSQRLGEMEHWALWAHHAGMAPLPAAGDGGQRALSPAAARLGRLLAVAGFGLEMEAGFLTVRRLPLDGEPPNGMRPLSLRKDADAGAAKEAKSFRTLADLYDALDAVTPETPAVLVFDPPLTGPLPHEALGWLPVLPAGDRPPRRLFDGSEEPHELTSDLRRVVRLLRKRQQARAETGAAGGTEDAELFYAVRRLMQDAYAAAVGRSATGQFSSKLAYLRRGVLGRRLAHSARATISPGGTLGLGLDEIGLPPALAYPLFGSELPEAVAGRWVWLKRDPVLHRWGLLPVRVRLVAGDTIRLPASLLGPLGADFDGDTVALFAALPGTPGEPRTCSPPALAWHPVLQEAMFKPGKQYQYGLFLLAHNAGQTARLQEALKAEGAPAWPDDLEVSKAFAEWVRRAAAAGSQGRWWAVLEEHSLAALAADLAMGFGLWDLDELAKLAVVRCGAAKDLYGGVEPPPDEKAGAQWQENRRALADIREGRSLTVYRGERRDPIADVMVAAKASIGQFGGALRRLVYSAAVLHPEDVQKAQCLTEQVTQKALSVKAGKPPLRYADFERQLRRLLKRQELHEPEQQQQLRALLAEIGKKLEPVWEDLAALMPSEPRPWLEWLRKPHELAELVDQASELRLPLDDLRLRGWFTALPLS
jgi:hypothetical protein